MATPIKIMTANVQGARRYGMEGRLEIFKDTIAGLDFDLAGFQEMGELSLEEARKAFPGHDFHEGEYIPNADIFLNTMAWRRSRFAPRKLGTYWLSESGERDFSWGGFERATSYGVFEDLADGGLVAHQNSHWDHWSHWARDEESKMDVGFARALRQMYGPTMPIFFTADTNTNPDSPHERWRNHPELLAPYHRLTRAFADLVKAYYGTRPQTFVVDPPNDDNYDPDIIGVWAPDREISVLNMNLIHGERDGKQSADHRFIMGEVLLG